MFENIFFSVYFTSGSLFNFKEDIDDILRVHYFKNLIQYFPFIVFITFTHSIVEMLYSEWFSSCQTQCHQMIYFLLLGCYSLAVALTMLSTIR